MGVEQKSTSSPRESVSHLVNATFWMIEAFEHRKDMTLPWDDRAINGLLAERKMVNLQNAHSAVVIALAPYISALQNNASVIDIGIGDGQLYPLFSNEKHIRLIGIEPERQMVERGVAQGRLPRDIQIIDTLPPYDDIPNQSVDLMYSVSTFHAVSEVLLRSIIRNLKQKFRGDEKFVAIQDIGTGNMYLQHVSQETMGSISEYILHKYALSSFDIGKLFDHGGLLGLYHERVLADVYRSISHAGRVQNQRIITIDTPEEIEQLSFHKSWDMTREVIREIAQYRHSRNNLTKYRTEDEIRAYIKAGDKKGVMKIVHALHRYLKLLHEMPDSYLQNPIFQRAMIGIGALLGYVKQDIYEGYLQYVFSSEGFSVTPKRATTYSEYEGYDPVIAPPYASSSIDGSLNGIPTEGDMSMLLSTRVFVAENKMHE